MVPVSRDGGLDAFWSRDSRTLYYTAVTKLMAADLDAAEPVRFGQPHEVLDLPHTHVFGRLGMILNSTGAIRQRLKSVPRWH